MDQTGQYQLEHGWDRDRLGDLVSQSAPLWSFLAQGSGRTAGRMGGERWNEWQTLSGLDSEALTRRLQWEEDSLAEEAAAIPEDPPEWTGLIQAFTAEAQAIADRAFDLEGEFARNEARTVAFFHLLVPFRNVAARELRALCPHLDRVLSQTAQDSLFRQITRRIADFAFRVFELEFATFRVLSDSTWDPQSKAVDDDSLYREFVAAILDDGFVALFSEYAVLARLIGTATGQWLNASAELIGRLEADAAGIGGLLGETDVPLLPAQDLICGLSDAHNGGRSVVCVITRTGSRVAYKPKPLELDGELIRLSKWIDTVAAGDDRLALFIPRVLAMGPYGWTEWIEPLPCESESEAKLSYARTGTLLCVLHHLYAIDVHRENLIAHGDRPYFIDSETLMQPMARGSAGSGIEETSASYRLEQLLADSVLRTGMVPAWVFSNSREQSLDESGLGGTGLEAFERVPVWRNINSDWMELEYVAPEEGGAVFSNNVVRIGGRALDSSAYVSEIVDGYRAMYDLILTNREIWKEDGGFLDTLSRQDVRFVFRPTQVYATILAHALTPNCLRSGEKRSMVLDRLAVGYLSFPEKPAVWDLLKSEIAALEQCDIPFFTVKVSETALRHAHGECPEYFERPVKEAILERLDRMGPTDAEFQVAILRGSFAARVLTGMTDDSSENGMGTLPELSREAAIARCERWGQELLDRAIEGEDGSLTWLGIGYVPQANQVQFRPLGDNLYDGRPGVAIFFASLFKITGEEKWADAAQATVRTLVQGSTRLAQVVTGEDAPATEIGGAVGVGSAIYALTQCGTLLGDRSMIEAAERVAGLLDACIEHDVYYDVVVGTAGALLSLLALAKVNPEGIAPGLAARCAKHLVNAAEPTGVGVMGWRTMEGHFLTGMSHGVAGVAYALARYAEYSDDADLMELAMAGIRYENQFFDAEAGNWRDLRASGPGFASSWCYGAPGIGLARLGMWRAAETEELLQDVRFALASIESAPMSRSDHPCCGTLGKAELAIEAFEALGDERSLDLARKQAAHVMAKEDANGRLTFYEGYPDCYNPGFFQGVAGIGYSLLRIACPGQLPSIMLWEAPR